MALMRAPESAAARASAARTAVGLAKLIAPAEVASISIMEVLASFFGGSFLSMAGPGWTLMIPGDCAARAAARAACARSAVPMGEAARKQVEDAGAPIRAATTNSAAADPARLTRW
jgi:hypothetical protein